MAGYGIPWARTMQRADAAFRTLLTFLTAALVLAAENAYRIDQLASRSLQRNTLLRLHFYDLSLFVLLGVFGSVAVVVWVELALRYPTLQRRSLRTLCAGAFGGALGYFVLANDFANFVANQALRTSPGFVGLLFGSGVFVALAFVFRRVSGLFRRWFVGGIAVVLGAYNSELLAGDYPGIHLFVASTGLVLLAAVFRSSFARIRLLGQRLSWAVASLVVGTVIFYLPPSRIVRQNLGISSGSALVPFILPWLPRNCSAHEQRLPVESSPWYRTRSAKDTIAPTAGVLLPDNGAILVLTIDALRADVIESRKHDATLPHLARLRDASLYFTNARSTAPSTLTTVTALMTGKYYSQIYFSEVEPGRIIPAKDRSLRVPELLKGAGVTTVHARALYGIGDESGVGRGFTREPKTPKDYGRASQLMDLVLAELDGLRRSPEQRLFLYGHFVDSHAPYTLGGKRKTPFESYLAEVALIDREVGRLLDYLERYALKDRVLLVVAADHGEAFGEHGMRYHARSVYDELLRVPLMVHFPRVPVSRIDEPVTLLDLSATVLDLFKLPTPGDFMGQSLVPVLLGKPARFGRPIAADSGRRMQALLFENGIKVIRDARTGNVQVFDLNDDPKELHDLLDDGRRNVEPFIGATERFFATHTLKVPGWTPPWRSF